MMEYLTEFWRRPTEHFPTVSEGNNTVSVSAETVRVPKPMPKMCPRKAKKMARLNALEMVLLFADRPLTVTELAGLMKVSVVEASRRCSEASFVVKQKQGRNVFVSHRFK